MKVVLMIVGMVALGSVAVILFREVVDSIDEMERENEECGDCQHRDCCNEDCNHCPCTNCPVGCSSFGNPDTDIYDDGEYDDEYDYALDDDFM